MSVIRWAPAPAPSIQSEFGRLFGTFFDSQAGRPATRRWLPAIDLVERDDEFVLTADVPGLDGDALTVEVDDGVLTIAGERSSEESSESGSYRRIERVSGSFRRSLRLPDGVDPEQVTAAYRDGVLEVHVPKPEQPVAHRVTVEVAHEEPAAA